MNRRTNNLQEAIRRLRTRQTFCHTAFRSSGNPYCEGKAVAYGTAARILSEIPRERPPHIDEDKLRKEIKSFLDTTGAPYCWCNDDEQAEWLTVAARHFAEWALRNNGRGQ